MSHGPARGYGLTAELQRKQAAKFSADLANEALEWVAQVLTYDGDDELANEVPEIEHQKDVWDTLKNGVMLCKVINVIQPDIVRGINKSNAAFKQMENIGKFLAACEELGMVKTDLFQTVDLYDQNNIPQVIATIMALGRKSRKVDGYDGPKCGPEESSKNTREFSPEQLAAGKSVIGLQMGSNKGASQAGQNFGKTRAIID